MTTAGIQSATEAGLLGMAAALRAFEKSAERLVRTIAPEPDQLDSVDISTEAVNLIRAERAFETSAKVVKAGQDIQDQLLDLLG